LVRDRGAFVPATNNPFGPAVPDFQPQMGDVLIRYGTFMGKPATPHITFYEEAPRDPID
jgi:hypothetical protein